MGKAWSMRLYQEGDMNSIFELVKAVWGENVSEKGRWIKGWKWMFTNNPTGASMIWLVEDKRKFVGQYPVILENMKINNKTVKGAQLVDTMTHPGYRHQGIASTLSKKALSEMERRQICLVYCFPTQQVYPLHIKSGWLDVCTFQIMFKPLNLRNLLEKYLIHRKFLLKILTTGGNLFIKIFFRTKRVRKVDGLAIIKASYFDERFNKFWEEICNDYNIIVVRSKSYLNWRYVNVPNAKYTIYVAEKGEEIYGYIVLGYIKSKGLIFGYIYDIIASLDREEIIQHLISKATGHFKKKKVDVIFSQMVPNKIYRKALLKNGFIPRFKSKSHFLVYNLSSKLSRRFIKNTKNWFIQLGDLPTVY